jgi:tetratricopeptide (TPR) repeat protein
MTRPICITVLASALTVFAGARSHAQLAPLNQSVAPRAADDLASQSVETELAGDHTQALKLADDAIKTDPNNPWGRYAKGSALGSLQRTDDAAASFREAEQHFSNVEIWGKSIAIWGQANAFLQVGRCQEASSLYDRYATFVEKVDQEAAALGRRFEKSCVPRTTTP